MKYSSQFFVKDGFAGNLLRLLKGSTIKNSLKSVLVCLSQLLFKKVNLQTNLYLCGHLSRTHLPAATDGKLFERPDVIN